MAIMVIDNLDLMSKIPLYKKVCHKKMSEIPAGFRDNLIKRKPQI